MFRAGNLDQRIKFLRYTSVSDGMGGDTLTKTELGECWASVKPKSGGERLEGDRVDAQAGVLFVVRYRNDILESDRIEWQGIEYNIRLNSDHGNRKLYSMYESDRGMAQ